MQQIEDFFEWVNKQGIDVRLIRVIWKVCTGTVVIYMTCWPYAGMTYALPLFHVDTFFSTKTITIATRTGNGLRGNVSLINAHILVPQQYGSNKCNQLKHPGDAKDL